MSARSKRANLSFKITTLRSIKFRNQSDLYYDLRNVFLNYNFKKTDIVYLARYNREKISQNNYSLIEKETKYLFLWVEPVYTLKH